MRYLTKLKLSSPAGPPCSIRRLEPVTFGLPFPRGVFREPSTLAVLDPGANPLPTQVRILDRWSDQSVRWALLSFQASTSSDASADYDLMIEPPGARAPAGIVAATDGPLATVDTGVLRVVLGPGGTFPFRSVVSSGRQALDCKLSGLPLTDTQGRRRPLRVTRVAVEDPGPVRTTVVVEGLLSAEGRRHLAVDMRLRFHAGSAAVRFDVTLRNEDRTRHPGGIWTLGAGGSVRFREAAIELVLPKNEHCDVFCSPETEAPLELHHQGVHLYQESSGGPNWRSHNHVNGDGVVPMNFRGYRLRTAAGESHGLRATPVVVLRTAEQELDVAVPNFWQSFPKALRAEKGAITIALFPGEFPDRHEIQGGEQKTHRFWVAFGRDQVTSQPLDWCITPLLARATPEWYSAAAAVPYLTPATDDPNGQYLCLVKEAIDGDETFERKREVIDEYGWRNFGDIYADHEAVFSSAGEPLVSHYNNQYDAVGGLACQFLRSGATQWWTQMDELADHVIDIDIYHTKRDKAAFNGGLFWHTFHYKDADRCSHRSYPRLPGVNGGGPSNEHNYTTGLMVHHFLTGEPASREAVIGLADWVLDMDDGRKTVFRWLARGETGLASSTASTRFHGPGRGAGNSINALLDAHRLTGEKRYLEKAERLLRRCVHPEDDVTALDLLDAERRWSYTVFLAALGKYLDHKRERNDFGRMYDYARESLLRYARWMASNERPYLANPETLEYPTETWAALDMKKSEVFMVASRYVDGQEKERLLERADFFFRESTSRLVKFETRKKARPLVLMLSHGFMWAWFRRGLDIRLTVSDAAAAERDFGAREAFVPQKVRAMRRAVAIFVATAVLSLALLLITLLR